MQNDAKRWYWPGPQEQEQIASWMLHYPIEGPGLCYKLGFFRMAGLSFDAAVHKITEHMQQEGMQPCGYTPVAEL